MSAAQPPIVRLVAMFVALCCLQAPSASALPTESSLDVPVNYSQLLRSVPDDVLHARARTYCSVRSDLLINAEVGRGANSSDDPDDLMDAFYTGCMLFHWSYYKNATVVRPDERTPIAEQLLECGKQCIPIDHETQCRSGCNTSFAQPATVQHLLFQCDELLEEDKPSQCERSYFFNGQLRAYVSDEYRIGFCSGPLKASWRNACYWAIFGSVIVASVHLWFQLNRLANREQKLARQLQQQEDGGGGGRNEVYQVVPAAKDGGAYFYPGEAVRVA